MIWMERRADKSGWRARHPNAWRGAAEALPHMATLAQYAPDFSDWSGGGPGATCEVTSVRPSKPAGNYRPRPHALSIDKPPSNRAGCPSRVAEPRKTSDWSKIP